MPIKQIPEQDITLRLTAAELSSELHALARSLESNEKTVILAPQIREAADIIYSTYKALR
jgi:RecA/RadA recombinase